MTNNNPYAEEYDDAHNPFQAPKATPDNDGLHRTNADAIRHEYLSHEASVKSIGLLYMIGGALMILVSGGMLFAIGAGPANGVGIGEIGLLLMFPTLAVIQIVTAVGIRRLRGWARIPAGILSAIGLLGFPIGTLINGYILYLLFSAKGSMVFSEEYQKIMAATPHIEYKTSIIVWIFFGLLLCLLAFGVIGALFVG